MKTAANTAETYTNSYDALGRLVQQQSAALGSLYWQYDAAGLCQSKCT